MHLDTPRYKVDYIPLCILEKQRYKVVTYLYAFWQTKVATFHYASWQTKGTKLLHSFMHFVKPKVQSCYIPLCILANKGYKVVAFPYASSQTKSTKLLHSHMHLGIPKVHSYLYSLRYFDIPRVQK